ncbi:MAG: excinuclease ABC subunit UvrC, partial [Gammaproteobacteria bacterium]|nr:excinuclease ABC subunit UvrC [Gammaproteobacteria bacterium]
MKNDPAIFDHALFLKTLTNSPGIYRMLNATSDVIYVGKARHLKKRVSSYFTNKLESRKTEQLVSRICHIEITVTRTEADALLLEASLIKELQPKYNVLLRDDKSYPYIYVTTHQTFPRLILHRGARHKKGEYFGPYPSAYAARQTIYLLQKIFQIRQCEDSYFSNRSRPCLQYQIKRCTAPCVNLIEEKTYKQDIDYVVKFLKGKNHDLIDDQVLQMEQASAKKDYEQAAMYRDRIEHLRQISEQQFITGSDVDLDIVTAVQEGNVCCVTVFNIRNGHNLGNKSFFPKIPAGLEVQESMAAFLSQYYLRHAIPKEIIIEPDIDERDWLENALTQQSKHVVSIKKQVRSHRKKWQKMARVNAQTQLQARLSSREGVAERLSVLQEQLSLAEIPQRIECFDVSHSSGEATVASCVVFDQEGPKKSAYRKFNIDGVTPGDDYAAMHQAIHRRFKRLKLEEAVMPDLLLIDGGKGQVTQAVNVLEELQIDQVTVIGVAKGVTRKPGFETLIDATGREFVLKPDSPALHLIQQVRDEAHRFAITSHRKRRQKSRNTSTLESLVGVGPKRRKTLLNQFGGL